MRRSVRITAAASYRTAWLLDTPDGAPLGVEQLGESGWWIGDVIHPGG